VEVTDTLGNTSVARQQIRVAPANDSAVTLSRHNATYATARVDASGFVQQIRAAEGAVVGTENVSLTRLDASFPAQERVDLTFRATNATPSSLNGTGIGLFEIGHWNTTAEQVSLRFGVERAALNRTGADPGDVTLYRNASEWSALNTSVVSREDARVEYTADSPGLSQFAVSVTPEATNSANQTGNETVDNETVSGNETAANSTAGGELSANETTGGGASENETAGGRTDGESSAPEPTGSPDIVVGNVTVNATDPSVGDNVSVNVTATNRGTIAGNYSVTVVLNNTTLATNQMRVGPGATRTERFVHELPDDGALVVDERRVANVSSGGGLVSMLPGPLGGIVSALPNPLALWPDGIVGTILSAIVGLLVVVYAILKALAIYLGY